jgi:hypothetical protein
MAFLQISSKKMRQNGVQTSGKNWRRKKASKETLMVIKASTSSITR